MSVVQSETASKNKRAQAGEEMAGGAADWNKGGLVGVWVGKMVGVFNIWICQQPKRDVFCVSFDVFCVSVTRRARSS